MVRLAGEMGSVDIVIGFDLALAVDLLGVRIDETEAIEDHAGLTRFRRFVSNWRPLAAQCGCG